MDSIVILWLILSIVAFGFSVAGLLDTLADRTALKLSGQNGLRKELVNGQLRSEALRTAGLALFLATGVIAALHSPFAVWLLISGNACFLALTAAEWQLRNKLKERVARMHQLYDDTKHSHE